MSDKRSARYPGAYAFADDPLARRLFFARGRESIALANQILSNRLVVLFARSGLGKTSLLNAGVSERLRDEGFTPLSVRLNDTRREPVLALYAAIEDACRRQKIEYVCGSQLSFWHFFKTAEFWRGDRLLTPVLILDQFEELFTLYSERRRGAFLDQLSFIVRGIRPSSLPSDDDENKPAGRGISLLGDTPPPLRIVISMREDFLPRLEEVADRIAQILDVRCRLLPLSREAATEAIDEPAGVEDHGLATHPFEIDKSTKETILDFLTQRGGRSTDAVEPFQLQLICQHIESAAALKQREATAGERVVVTLQDLGGVNGLRDILKDFYKRQVEAVPGVLRRRRVRKLCSEYLISPQGRRLRMEETEIQRLVRVDQPTLHVLVDKRLLRADQSADGVYYELSHDSLIGPVLDTQRWRFRARAIGSAMGALLLLSIAAGWFGFLSLLLAPIKTTLGRRDPFELVFMAAVIFSVGVVSVVSVRQLLRAFRISRDMVQRSRIR